MNRYSQPLWRAVVAIFSVTVCAALYLFFGGIVFNAKIPVAAYYVFFVSYGCFIVTSIIASRTYGKPHIHTSIITEVWIERRDRLASNPPPLSVLRGKLSYEHVMFTLKSGGDAYKVEETSDAYDIETMAPGDLVTIERNFDGGRQWSAKIISLTPRGELAKYGAKKVAKTT